MKNIVVVECKSTGKNFIEDIVNMGYNPIVLETNVADTEEGKKYSQLRTDDYANIKHDFELIHEKETYDETLEMVKEYDPLLVLPANERGVILASKLAYDLDLMANDIENLDAMTLKDEMHNRLAECGLRYIKGKTVTLLEEALEFYDSEGLTSVVIKPVYGSGSASVRICDSRDEIIEAFKLLPDKTNEYGDENEEFLVQERIRGEEYIVNTVSSDGVHRVTTVWKYHKVKTNDGTILYDSMDSVNELSIGEAKMIEYAYKVADALGIRYGAVHGEYMIDDNGPVLIEVNCRPMGGDMTVDFLDRISGQHETDSVLYAYLKPDLFKEQLKREYQLFAYASIKFFIVSKDIVAKSAPMKNISLKLESHLRTKLEDISSGYSLNVGKTEDLHSSPGTMYLVHEDLSVVQKDIEFIRNIERNAFSMVLSSEMNDVDLKDDESYINDVRPLVEGCQKYGIGLFVTDQFIDDVDILQVNPLDIDNVIGTFDFIVINLNKSIVNNSSKDVIESIWASFSKVKKNGFIFIPENTYELLDGGRNSMEVLIKAAGLKIVLPPYGVYDTIMASKK